jgi:DNA-binding transcriptional MerR regulator
MSAVDDTVYTARQVSEALGVSTAMIRKYAATFEAITGERIKQHPRDGRLYTRDQLDALIAAKGFVDTNAGMSVDTALRITLGRAESAIKEPQAQPTGINTSAFAEAILAELRGLRLANERLLERLEALESRQLPSPKPAELEAGESAPATGVHGDAARFGVNDERIDRALEVEMQASQAPATPSADRPGILVRAAQRLEGLLYRKG